MISGLSLAEIQLLLSLLLNHCHTEHTLTPYCPGLFECTVSHPFLIYSSTNVLNLHHEGIVIYLAVMRRLCHKSVNFLRIHSYHLPISYAHLAL